MPAPDQEYRSLMLRKAQRLAQQHGGISNIPKEIQKRFGFDVIAGRRGIFSISVRIPDGDLSSSIAQLKAELPAAQAFGKSKPGPDSLGKYVPVPSTANPTMDDFWVMQGWYKEGKTGIKLTRAKWKDDEKVRAEAVRFLAEKVLKKDPRDITADDFRSNRLAGLLGSYHNGSPHTALTEAGYQINPWEMLVTPDGFYDSKENRAAATKWLVQKLQKDPKDITQDDFTSNRLSGLCQYYKNSPYAALVEAEYAYSKEDALQHAKEGAFKTDKIYAWEMTKTPSGFYDLEENRIAATKWLVEKLKKEQRDTTAEDFISNRLAGLLRSYYNSSPYEALLEAGAVTPEDEAYMRRHGSVRFSEI